MSIGVCQDRESTSALATSFFAISTLLLETWPQTSAPWPLAWEIAGFVPRLFDFAYHKQSVRDVDFHQKLITKLQPLSQEEQELEKALLRAWGNNMRIWL
jgi:hypothetical protein